MNNQNMISQDTFFAFRKHCWLYPLLAFIIAVASSAPSKATDNQRYFEYQNATQFTHLVWPSTLSPKYKVKFAPIKNFTGMPIEHREEDSQYYLHGNMPAEVQNILVDTFEASRLFEAVASEEDFNIQLTIDSYKLPFKYAPDDTWWQALHDDTDRWLQTPGKTYIKASLKLTGGKRPLKPWMDSVEIVLSNCDLNAIPQPTTAAFNNNQQSKRYLSTTPGQTFLAATNFLLLKAIDRLSQESTLGSVTRKYGQSIYLQSEHAPFVQGRVVNLLYNHKKNGVADIPAGQLKIIKTMHNKAIAYPINLSEENIRVGDWVELRNPQKVQQPEFVFEPANQCASVFTAEVD
ncbi:hypothetical protein FLL45_00505 [Aliikangiella marina]|uniref:Uncharacterized protein n=1 Tax=Aliikangiella marina TaxID=1712262 RepID=A0A545TGX3_9GAMM|nr:hypothetical protein [Aliikangiella marina]TQV76479.1 hypothetical protein FLL45_00505 [Aliikangiella marina]